MARNRDVQPLPEPSGAWNYWRRIDQVEESLAAMDERLKRVERVLAEMSAYLQGR
jgi:hypothetical protein